MSTCKNDNFQSFLNGLTEKNCIVKNKPVQLLLGLTNACNLHCAFCPYCGFCSAKIEMVYMLSVELIEALKPYLKVAQFVNPSGRGEPLLYRHFSEFLGICRECDALSAMQLTNNGTQLQRYDLAKMEGINIIAISVDSVDTRTFEILRYGAKLEQVLDNVKRLREALPNTVLQWCVVVNRLNIGQLADIYIAAREFGINYITFNDVYGYEEDKVVQLLRLRESDRPLIEEQFRKISALNADGKLVVNNVISWSGYEDGEALDKGAIFSELEKLKEIEPYLSFDKLNCNDIESRRIKSENQKGIAKNEIRIPYCTNPFEVMFIQPDGTVSPCCASYGTIDKIEGTDIGGVWNGRNYQLLREAMFDWDMLPDYCRKCEAFMRYDYIDDFWNALKAKNGGSIPGEIVKIPPNYFPPEGAIKSEDLMTLIQDNHNRRGNLSLIDRQQNIHDFLSNMVEQNTVVSNSPVQLLIGLTNVCNLHCSFCLYCGFCMKKIEKTEMLPWDTLEKLRGYLESANIVIPSGRGEPLIYDKFSEFMQLCRETGAIGKMQLVNNGTLLNRYEPEVLEGINILSISFDSVHKEIFELLRYGANYDRILSNIQYIRKALPDTVMQFSVTVNRLNMEELSDIYLLARDLGINYVSFNNLYGPEEDKVVLLLRLRNSDKAIIEGQLKKIDQLNADKKIEIINAITWPQPEDGSVYDKEKIFSKLSAMKDIIPYLDYDELSLQDTLSRAIHEEARHNGETSPKKLALPYCTNPYCVFMLQPDENVSPCCGAFGAITNMKDKNISEVWNGNEYQLLREAMFQYDMLPDYCKKCREFIRYDYINEYIDLLKSSGHFNYDSLIVPPNYFPPEGLVKDPEVQRRIELSWETPDGSGAAYKTDTLNMQHDIIKNSKDYWDIRFSSKDWQKYDGNEQSRYFAHILINMLPEWLIHEVNEHEYAICDVGCAEGDALEIYRQTFPISCLHGEDFSQSAIAAAIRRHSDFQFEVRDLLETMDVVRYPVVICSNVIEHFKDSYRALYAVCEKAEKYAIVMIPYREQDGAIEEHEHVFHTSNIPMQVNGKYLAYAKSMSCQSPYYPYEQLLLVYTDQKNFFMMSDLVENVSSDREKVLCEEIERQKTYVSSIEEERDILQTQIAALKNEFLTAQNDLSRYKQDIEETRNRQICAEQNLQLARSILGQKDEYIYQTQELCSHFATGKLMKLNHLLFRIKGQLLKGNKSDRKEFMAWLRGRIKHTNHSLGAGAVYNPLMVINRKLQDAANCRFLPVEYNPSTARVDMPSSISGHTPEQDVLYSLPQHLRTELAKDYTYYDVIILSVIDYDFRHQRPQHFAARFAANGHRVFYINANFIHSDSVVLKQNNLFVVDFSNSQYNAIYAMDGHSTLPWMRNKFDTLLFEQGIRDAIVVVDYPNWIAGAEYLREKYGFKIITDYMDDYTGFLGTAEEFLKDNCVRLLQSSDMIVASSQFLFEVAASHADKEKIEIIRNGTETEHFYQAVNLETPGKKRKVIGYYGAVAHWFAWEKVCCLAKKFPDCDVVIVGAVTEHKDKLERYNNIKLLGEKPYKELPKYLADFDVCLIPFDTSTDLIKATNPVKFYEYLSAGKKIVSTEIPELMPYRDQYVYMSNDNDTFAEYVRLCLEGQDCLKSQEERIAFARENDWQKRYEVLEKACVNCIPKVSIIVLTYNNLDLNKQCIESILHKTAYGNYELIIVDNASSDGTVEYLSELQSQEIPEVKIILNDQNRGFAGGNNVGIEAAAGDYVLLLNNDTVVSRGWLTALVKHLENNEKYAMCNPVTNAIGNESMVKAIYTNLKEFYEYAYAYTACNMNTEYRDVDRLPLFATLIRRKVIDEAGMLDESYEVGMFEDDDFTEAVKAKGYNFLIADDAFVHHLNNASFIKLDDRKYRAIFEKNKSLFEKKWKRKWYPPKYRQGITANINEGTRI